MFSHFTYFDELLDAAWGTDESKWCTHERVSLVRSCDRWVPYPFQNNLAALPTDEQVACLTGLVRANIEGARATRPPETFDEWIMRVFGEGIANLFMRPYNLKVWGYPTSAMQCRWLGERVAPVDAVKAVEDVIRGTLTKGWGPNATFRFPSSGGTGAVWRAVADMLPPDKIRCSSQVVSVDLEEQTVLLQDGT
jgi:protoporphyrinogen oxidase